MSNVTTTSTLTDEDRTFALAVIEYGGNLGAAARAAYGDEVRHPIAFAREKLCQPEIAKYVQALSAATEEHAFISLGSHLTKLAEIRDLAIGTDQLKVALAAEKSRGEAAGFYAAAKGPFGKAADDGPKNPSVVINVGSSPVSVSDWASKHGSGTVIDVQTNAR